MNRDNAPTTAITSHWGRSTQSAQYHFFRKVLGGTIALLLTLCAALLGLAAPSQAQTQPNPQPATITSFQYTATGVTLNWTAQSYNYGIVIPFGNYRPYCQIASNGNYSFSSSASSPVATYNSNTNLWTETGTFTISSLQPSTTYRFLVVGSRSGPNAPLIYSSNYAQFTTLAVNPLGP